MSTRTIRRAQNRVSQALRYHPFSFAVYYELFFVACFWLLEKLPRTYYIIDFPLDRYVPFCRYAIVPYYAWFAWAPALFGLIFLLSVREFWRVYEAFAWGSFITLAVYLVFPTGLALREPHLEQDLFTRLVNYIQTVDNPYNVCPSMHVYATVVLAFAVFDSKVIRAVWFRVLTAVMTLSICTSTVLLDQHSLVDVFCAVALAAVCYGMVRRSHQERPLPFSSLDEVACPACLRRMAAALARHNVFA